MRRGRGLILLCIVLGFMLAILTPAQVVKKGQHTLDDLVMASGRLFVPQTIVPGDQLRAESLAVGDRNMEAVFENWDGFLRDNGTSWEMVVDRRSGRPALVSGSGIPWIPGKGNALTRADVQDDSGSNGRVDRGTLLRLCQQFIERYPEFFGAPPSSFTVMPQGTGEYGGYLWYVQLQRTYEGIPVENSFVVFRVNNGNLVQFGGENLGRISIDATPSVDSETARQILQGYLGGLDERVEWLNPGTLSILPVAPEGDTGLYVARPGGGEEFRLAYTLVFRSPEVMGTWMARIDAHTGEILSFVDANKYGSIKGGIYVTSNLDTEVVRPMGFADSATSTYADAAGTYTQTSGTVTTTLKGKYVKVTDSCGSISLSGTAPADLNLGTSSGTDCTTPGVGGSGNTHAARSTYYHLTLWKEKAMAWLPSNTWLKGQLTDKVNLNQTCNAYWDGSGVNFFKSGGGCSNTGELPTVFLHEVGHGLDSYDGSPNSTVGSSESYADINAVLMTHNSCIGVNFFTNGSKCSGYGNACTTCTGIRDADYAKHTYSTSPAVPSQLTGTTGYHCSASSSYPGPCGREGHCESYIMSEVGWDIAARDLPSAGFDTNTSWYIADRLFFLTRPTSGDAYSCPSVSTANGCGSTNWYETYLAADDDNGNLSDGTPHAAAIYAAFNRHAIACSTGSHTSYSACGSIGQPTLTATAGSASVNLSWTAVSGATKYKVLRNELGATAGMTIMATPTATSYTDTTVAIGVTYYYAVVAVGSSDACFGALSAVKSATPTAGATYSISGTVSGAITSGVTMTLSGAANATTTTATGGTYTFAGLSNGSYTVTPSKSGYTFSPTSLSVTVSGANQTGKNFTATAVPTYSISGTVGGDTASGVTMTLSGAASATTTTATGGTYTFAGLSNGSYTVTPSKAGYIFSPTSLSVTISGANQTGKNFTATASGGGCSALTASYNATYHCPAVTQAASSVTAPSTLLSCRGTTGESNAPNTIDGCADGNSGSCHSDESIEAITVASTDGVSCMAPGQQVTVTVSTYCYSNADYVTLFYSTNASSPSWTKVGSTQQATGSGTKTFTWTFTLGGTAGSAQALRAQMTYNADPGTAACVSGSYNDRDDLVFVLSGSVPSTYSISGTVSGATASGVTMTLTGAASKTATTDTSGNYTFTGLSNGTYTVTPSKSGYSFSPASLSVTISGANQTGKNFTATSTATYSILGTVSGDTASGVTMALSGAASGSTSTDTSGNYTFSGLSNGTYTVTPSKTGYTFSPTSLSVTISGANQTGKNFTATAVPGGDTPLNSGVGVNGSVALHAYNYYTIAVPTGATNLDITLTGLSADIDLYVNNNTTHPTTSSYYGRSWNGGTTTESLSYASPTATTWCIAAYGYAAGSYTVTATVTMPTATYSISGTITLNGSGLGGVSVSTGGTSATTNSSGVYTLSGLANGSYTVTPSLSGYTFSPASLSVTISGANQTGKNFTATATGGSTTLFDNGFESSTGWASVDTSGTAGSWTRVTSGTYPSCQEHSGSYMAKFNSYNASNGSATRYYRTSGFAVSSSFSTVTLTFWMYHDTGYSSSADKVQVQVSTNGTTWTNVGTAVNRYDGSTGWKQHTVNLSTYKGQSALRVAFLGTSAYGNNCYIDDVLVVGQ